ncbi:hypothetical protein OIU85_029072 [Salix viminalis]|uniref:Uncharacterized protein n=1 Tax=Salix viminalis TaxID=40686 RepID=A0A9Q0QAT2_SALVM|nr:hypothetical protein OIU85_029072 [Salix viminalis]
MNRRDLLSVQIGKKLGDLPSDHSACSIFQVPSRRRRHVNERASEPGNPSHRGKDKLKMMEEYKKGYLQKLLQRTVERYVAAMRGMEGKARQFYDQSVSLGQDGFVDMLHLIKMIF